jgi:hypothetical protein
MGGRAVALGCNAAGDLRPIVNRVVSHGLGWPGAARAGC